MPNYSVTVHTTGFAIYEVEADSKEDAEKKVFAGEADLIEETVTEVRSRTEVEELD